MHAHTLPLPHATSGHGHAGMSPATRNSNSALLGSGIASDTPHACQHGWLTCESTAMQDRALMCCHRQGMALGHSMHYAQVPCKDADDNDYNVLVSG